MSVSYDRATELVGERLSQSAALHSARVADMAALLATVYGVDVESARLAGLLHDWDREVDAVGLVADAQSCGLAVDPAEAAVPYLLHARTGAAKLEESFPGISRAIVQAVERHTLGAVDMSDLDMVVFLADMLEPGREFGGVDDLREAVGTVDLTSLFALAYQQSVKHLVDVRKCIHPLTVEVWNRYVARSQQ